MLKTMNMSTKKIDQQITGWNHGVSLESYPWKTQNNSGYTLQDYNAYLVHG